jgi:hypothetical protein
MGDRDTFLANAADCRERARHDAAHADYWTDRAIDWLQRAAETSREAFTHEMRGGQMIVKQPTPLRSCDPSEKLLPVNRLRPTGKSISIYRNRVKR